MLRKLGFWGILIVGFGAMALPAIQWARARGVSDVGAWILVIVGGGVGLILIEMVASAVLEGAAAWVGSKLPEPIRRGLGKEMGGPLTLLGVLSIIAVALVVVLASTT